MGSKEWNRWRCGIGTERRFHRRRRGGRQPLSQRQQYIRIPDQLHVRHLEKHRRHLSLETALSLGHHKSFLHRFNGFLAARNITSHELKIKHPREESLQSRKQRKTPNSESTTSSHLHKRDHVTAVIQYSPTRLLHPVHIVIVERNFVVSICCCFCRDMKPQCQNSQIQIRMSDIVSKEISENRNQKVVIPQSCE